MNTHADKTQDNKSLSVANMASHKLDSGESRAQLVDNRPEAIAHQKLQKMANNSPQANKAAQLQSMANNNSAKQQQTIQKKDNSPELRRNNTGLPDNLKSGIENLSGYSMDDVKVHYHSDKPAQLQAHAFAQGTDIHLGSGQEKHLPHEAWHVVQQKQGRVQPTTSVAGAPVNDNNGLETEADVMGAKASSAGQMLVQRKVDQGEVDGQANSTEMTTMSFSSYMPSIQRVEASTIQRKRDRAKDEEEGDSSQLKQFQKIPVQRYSKVAQFAIKAAGEAPPGTKILVANPLANDTGDIGRVIRLSNSELNCMAVEFDNESGVLYRVYFNEINVIPDTGDIFHSTEKDQLKLMMDQAIAAAIVAVEELNAVMSTDKTESHSKIMKPAAQLEKCLIDCKGLTAEETATYLYTTYFYGPLNRYLRSPEVRLQSAVVQGLIDVTHAFLQRAFNTTPGAQLIPKFRMELQAEWIDTVAPDEIAKTGDALTFRAFTSTHPALSGVNGMWGDIESGAFGDVTKLALLVYQGTSKFLYPNAKYFPTEHEHILPPEMQTKISEKYQIHWVDHRKLEDDPKRIWTVTVYHLTVVGSGDVEQFRLDFDDYGNICRQ
tara:strand:- start:645 stop:2456 length:1812 start_codon:yes stop_codon:yes gene_type:complete